MPGGLLHYRRQSLSEIQRQVVREELIGLSRAGLPYTPANAIVEPCCDQECHWWVTEGKYLISTHETRQDAEAEVAWLRFR